jgi:hypothetical protein
MTRDDDFIGQLEGYLDEYEGGTPLPNEVRDAIRAQLPSTHQRPAWWPARRIPEMNSIAKLSVAAAVVAVAALLGFYYLGAPNVGGPGLGDPSPSPTPTPPSLPRADSIDPGTYALAGDGLSVAITVPAGWGNLAQRGVAKGADESAVVVTFWPYPTDFTKVYSDPCEWATSIIQPQVGPTVDDLADALAAQAMRGDAVPTAVTIDGYEGKYLDMTVPLDVDFASCDGGEFRSWWGRWHQGPGQVDRVYILDVDSVRQVFIAHHMPGASAADLAEQQAIVESIDFLP